MALDASSIIWILATLNDIFRISEIEVSVVVLLSETWFPWMRVLITNKLTVKPRLAPYS